MILTKFAHIDISQIHLLHVRIVCTPEFVVCSIGAAPRCNPSYTMLNIPCLIHHATIDPGVVATDIDTDSTNDQGEAWHIHRGSVYSYNVSFGAYNNLQDIAQFHLLYVRLR